MNILKAAVRVSNKVPPLLLEVEEVAHGFMRGVHGRKKYGQGETFWQFRQWQQGDRVADINWRQTAKSDNVYIKQTEWEAAQAVWVYRDNNPSMKYASKNKYRTKQEYAEILLLALSRILLTAGEKVGLLGTELSPQIGDSAVEKIYANLEYQIAMPLTPVIGKNSHVVIISDFFNDFESISQACMYLASKNIKVMLVQICDRAEAEFPFKGRIKFLDMLEHDVKLVSKSEDIADEYVRKFKLHQAKVENLAKSIGGKYGFYITDMKAEIALFDIFEKLAVKCDVR